ncbi:MAG: hypothetical protein ACXWUB_04910, partial [Burkholderiales bacterium]
MPGSVGTPILDERIAADRARALLQCTRAVLSARDEAELSSRVCRILVDSGVYAEAYMGLTDGEDLQAHPHSCYAGSNAAFMGNAAAFWVEAAHRSALRA